MDRKAVVFCKIYTLVMTPTTFRQHSERPSKPMPIGCRAIHRRRSKSKAIAMTGGLWSIISLLAQSGRELFKSTSFPWVSHPHDCQRSVMAKSCHYVVRKQTNAGSKTDVSISWLSIAESCTDIRAEFALMYGHPYLYKCNRTLRSLHP